MDMRPETVTAMNLETGQVGEVARIVFDHPVFNPGTLVEVEPGTKSYAPELYRSRLKEPLTEEVERAEEAPKPERPVKDATPEIEEK